MLSASSASAQLLPSLRRSFLPDNRRGWGRRGSGAESSSSLCLACLKDGPADIRTRGAGTKTGCLSSSGHHKWFCDREYPVNNGGVRFDSLCYVFLPSIIILKVFNRSGDSSISEIAGCARFYSLPMETFSAARFCSVTCCLVIMCNVHYQNFCLPDKTFIPKLVTQWANR